MPILIAIARTPYRSISGNLRRPHHGFRFFPLRQPHIIGQVGDKMTGEQEEVRRRFTELVRSPLHTFPDFRETLTAPARQGVYVIYNRRGKVVHVGRTLRAKGGIAQRLRDHMAGASSFTNHYLKGRGAKLRGKYKYRFIVIRSPRVRALLEAYATGYLCPAHIGLGKRSLGN